MISITFCETETLFCHQKIKHAFKYLKCAYKVTENMNKTGIMICSYIFFFSSQEYKCL